MENLPTEIKLTIFSFLDYKMVIKCREVSQKWKAVIANDLFWQSFFLRVFGIQKKPDEFDWFEFFKQTMAWFSFDANEHSPHVEISNSRLHAYLKPTQGSPGDRIPVRGSSFVKPNSGIHFFAIDFKKTSNFIRTPLYAVGIGKSNFPAKTAELDRAFVGEYGGIGYYSSGYIYLLGDAHSVTGYDWNDVVGFALDMNAGTIQFYKNFKPIDRKYSISKTKVIEKVYPIVLLCVGMSASVKHVTASDFEEI